MKKKVGAKLVDVFKGLEAVGGSAVQEELHPLSFDAYQEGAASTAIYPNKGNNLQYPTLGLCGEAGEVAENVKKLMRDDDGWLTDERREALVKEIGDTFWYLAALCSELGVGMGHVARLNLIKLADRAKRGVLKGSGDNR